MVQILPKEYHQAPGEPYSFYFFQIKGIIPSCLTLNKPWFSVT